MLFFLVFFKQTEKLDRCWKSSPCFVSILPVRSCTQEVSLEVVWNKPHALWKWFCYKLDVGFYLGFMKRGNVKAGFMGTRAVSEPSRSLKFSFISFPPLVDEVLRRLRAVAPQPVGDEWNQSLFRGCVWGEKSYVKILRFPPPTSVWIFFFRVFVSFTTEPNPWKLSISFLRPQGSQFCFSLLLLFRTNAIGCIKSLPNWVNPIWFLSLEHSWVQPQSGGLQM